MNEWMRLEEDCPEEEGYVLVCDSISKEIYMARFIHHEGKDYYQCLYDNDMPIPEDFIATHWMPLPELPEEEE
jgi:hypothetical protein